jgi:hypothetical protein
MLSVHVMQDAVFCIYFKETVPFHTNESRNKKQSDHMSLLSLVFSDVRNLRT